MRKRVAWMALVAATAMATNAGGQSGEGIVTIGKLGGLNPPFGDINVGDVGIPSIDVALGVALALFQSGNGQIVILRGEYDFAAAFTIPPNKSNMTIRGNEGAILRPLNNATSVAAIETLAHGTRLQGLAFRSSPTASANGQVIVQVGDGSPIAAFDLIDCSFEVTPPSMSLEDPVVSVTLVKAANVDDARLVGNRFAFAPSGCVSSWQPTAVRIQGGTSITVTRNLLHNNGVGSAPATIQDGYFFTDVAQTVFTCNTSVSVGCESSVLGLTKAILRVDGTFEAVVVADNFFEICPAANVVDLSTSDMGGFLLTGNTFGRNLGTFRYSGLGGGTVTGNQFHKSGPHHPEIVGMIDAVAVLLEAPQPTSAVPVNVSGNTFTYCSGTQVRAGAGVRAQVLGNRFVMDDNPDPGVDDDCVPAVELASGEGALIVGNAAVNGKEGFHWTNPLVLVVPGGVALGTGQVASNESHGVCP